MSSPNPPATADIIAAYIDVWNGGDDARLDAILDPAFQRTGDALSESADGVAGLRALLRKMRLDMPDLEVTIVDAVYTNDRAAVHWRLAGTDSGPGDFAPTNRHATTFGLALFRARDGRLVEEVIVADGLSMLLQLGFTLSPPQSSRPDPVEPGP